EPAADGRRSPRTFSRLVADYMKKTGLPLATNRLPEEASFYLPLDLADASEAPRVLVIVDDAHLDLDLGKVRADERFFESFVNGVPVLHVRPVDLLGNFARGRWKLFELTVDRGTGGRA